MAKLAMGILGGFSGKVGTIVGCIWKGVATIRAYVANVTNPNTVAQQTQRAKFKLMVAFLKPVATLLRRTFTSGADKKTAFNAALSYNIQHAVAGAFPNFTVDFTAARLSEGTICEPLNPVAASTIVAEVEFTWDDNSTYAGASPTDKAICIVYNDTKKLCVSPAATVARTVMSQVVALPAIFTGDEVKCYLAFANANGSIVSNSQYVSSLIVA